MHFKTEGETLNYCLRVGNVFFTTNILLSNIILNYVKSGHQGNLCVTMVILIQIKHVISMIQIVNWSLNISIIIF